MNTSELKIKNLVYQIEEDIRNNEERYNKTKNKREKSFYNGRIVALQFVLQQLTGDKYNEDNLPIILNKLEKKWDRFDTKEQSKTTSLTLIIILFIMMIISIA